MFHFKSKISKKFRVKCCATWTTTLQVRQGPISFTRHLPVYINPKFNIYNYSFFYNHKHFRSLGLLNSDTT